MQPQTFKLSRGTHGERFLHPNVWVRESSKGVPRLAVAAASHQVALIELLVEQMSAPFHLLYVLVVPRTGAMAARYQSPGVHSAAEISTFIDTYREAFEQDARHILWIKSVEGPGLIVYDRHNVLYLYGPLEAFAEVLKNSGLRQADTIEIPDPHGHHYWPDFDQAEEAILANGEWLQSSLREQDET